MDNFVRMKLEEWGLAILCDTFEVPVDDVSCIALQLLPFILPTGLVKNGNGKLIRASKTESLTSFIDVKPVGTNLPAYLEEMQQRAVGELSTQPSVLVMGTRRESFQSFVIVDGLAIEASSLLKAVDICFKCFYVFDMCYPKECHTTWEFRQKFFFKMGEGKGESVTSSGVKSLRTFIEKKQM